MLPRNDLRSVFAPSTGISCLLVIIAFTSDAWKFSLTLKTVSTTGSFPEIEAKRMSTLQKAVKFYESRSYPPMTDMETKWCDRVPG